MNKLVFELDEFNYYKKYFYEYYNDKDLYLFENTKEYNKALDKIKKIFDNKSKYLAFYNHFELRVICDLVIFSYYKEYQKENKFEDFSYFFSDKVIHRMIYFSGNSFYELLELVPEKLIKYGKIVNNLLEIAVELNKDYSKNITKPEEKSIFSLNLLERTIKQFEYDYKAVFFNNSQNLKFIDKFINLEENRKEQIKKQLDIIFLDFNKNLLILNENKDYKKAKMYREVGIDKIKTELKSLLKKC